MVIPAQVCVQDLTAKDAVGNVVTSYTLADVHDEVYVTVADWQPTNGGTLTVKATSSDTVSAPTLTLSGVTAPDPLTGQPTQTPVVIVGGTAVVNPVLAAPSAVKVASTKGGVSGLDTTTGLGFAASKTVPVANADSATTPENTPVTINELANDTLFKGPIPAGALVTITNPARLGGTVFNADNTIIYTPNPTTQGPATDLICYTVTVAGVPSNEAYITVTITAVNQAPTAIADTFGAVLNTVTSFNVLVNDTDPDGATDLAKAVIVTWPAQLGAQPVPTTGFVTFTPTISGTFQFTYNAQDQAGLQSAAPATVTVTVAAAETILVARSQFIVSKKRWVVSGTDTVNQGQTLTITLDNGTAAGTVVGTSQVVAGAWTVDTLTGPDPRASGATRIRITSSLGAFVLANITLK